MDVNEVVVVGMVWPAVVDLIVAAVVGMVPLDVPGENVVLEVFADTSHDGHGGDPLDNDDGDHLDNDGDGLHDSDDLLGSDDDDPGIVDGGDDRSHLEIHNYYDDGDGGDGVDNVANLEESGSLDSLDTAVDMEIVVELGSLAVDMVLGMVHVTLENLVAFQKYRQMDSMEMRCDCCIQELDIVEMSVSVSLAMD